MGRKTIVLTEKEKNRRKTSGLRIKALRKSIKYTQEKLAEELDISVATMRNYEYGIYPVPEKYISQLSIMSNGDFCEAYLSGESNLKTNAEYHRYWNENDYWPDPDAEARAEMLIEKEKVKALFLACGYNYIAEGMAAFDFLGIDSTYTESPKEANRLEPVDASSPATYFSDDEMDSLIAELKEHIAFTCYKKRRCI